MSPNGYNAANNRFNLRKHSVIPRRTGFATPVLFRGTVIDLVLIECDPLNTLVCVLAIDGKRLPPLLNSEFCKKK